MRDNLAAALGLLLVTDDQLLADRDVVAICRAAVRGGATAVQLRLKRAPDRLLFELAQRLVRDLEVPVFVNDRADVAIAAGAAGVHLGPDDLPPMLVRRIAPPGFVIGASVGSPGEVDRGAAADYWGIGPLRATTTKHDAGDALGWDGAAAILRLAGNRPAVVVGGVLPGDVPLAHAAGFAGVAVIRGMLQGEDVEHAARQYARERRVVSGDSPDGVSVRGGAC